MPIYTGNDAGAGDDRVEDVVVVDGHDEYVLFVFLYVFLLMI